MTAREMLSGAKLRAELWAGIASALGRLAELDVMMPMPPVTVPADTPAPAVVAPEAARKVPGRALPAAKVEKAPGSIQDRVAACLGASASPMRTAEIATALGISMTSCSTALMGLRADGRVTLTGRSVTARWQLVPSKNESSELEVVWNGSRARAGTAPSLSSVGRTS
jgi:hypothetical protein